MAVSIADSATERSAADTNGNVLSNSFRSLKAALIATDIGFYQRGSLIVRPAKTPTLTADGQEIFAPRLVHVTATAMLEAMTRAADFRRRDRGESKAINCPRQVADAYLAREGSWRLPVLSAIINTPIIRSDGTILENPGYDKKTGLLYEPDSIEYPKIPAKPSQFDAVSSLRLGQLYYEAPPRAERRRS